MKEGVIKFNSVWIKSKPIANNLITGINKYRNKLYKLGLIGETLDGIGFGNISQRYQKNTFIISGSGTGSFSRLTNKHYALVQHFNLEENTLTSTGQIVASSESLTHAVIYETQKNIHAVIHVHNKKLWKHLLQSLPATKKNISYGTVAMANEIKRLFAENDLIKHKIFAMAGHEDGVISFGKNFEEAFHILNNAIDEM